MEIRLAGIPRAETSVGAARASAHATKDAAAEFEALILTQMLKTAREEDHARSTDAVRDYADQQFASVLATAGGLGLANLVVSGLANKGN